MLTKIVTSYLYWYAIKDIAKKVIKKMSEAEFNYNYGSEFRKV